ncbi:MAG: ATP-binding protein [Candidatus Wallbacteria bacterium]|nr:ATP-binding protein [Candidatus Wallbacteria bacterium]
MKSRSIEKLIKQRLTQYPAVAIVGPRQCGKTTLAVQIGGTYFDLEQEQERLKLDLTWDKLKKSGLLILDEAQSYPEIFKRLRGAIDKDRKKCGRFLLLGSVSPSLMEHVSESLTGRLSIVELTPFLSDEIGSTASLDMLWLCGGFPDGGVLKNSSFPQWQKDYLDLITQRDLPNWGLPSKPQMTKRMLRMLAATHGQVWNASRMGQSLGINYKTVNSYLDFLAGSYLIRKLQPFHANIGKRLVKSPKVYWRDSGLLHSQFNIKSLPLLLDQPWVGASWEGFAIEQILGTLSASDVMFEPYYLRTNDQYEVDLLLDFGSELWAIEIKLTTHPGREDMARLSKTASMVKAGKSLLVSRVKSLNGDGNRISCNLKDCLKLCSALKK